MKLKRIKLEKPGLKVTLFLSLYLTFIIGSLWSMSSQDVTTVSDSARSMLSEVDSAPLIFFSNFRVSLLMCIPFFGVAFGFYVMWHTGFILHALSLSLGLEPLLMDLILLVSPVSVMEFTAYSIATSESVIFSKLVVWKILKRKTNENARKHLIFLALMVLCLAVAAVVEWNLGTVWWR